MKAPTFERVEGGWRVSFPMPKTWAEDLGDGRFRICQQYEGEATHTGFTVEFLERHEDGTASFRLENGSILRI